MPRPHPKREEMKNLRQQGLSHYEIAIELSVSKHTVAKVVKNIKLTNEQKIEIKNRGIKRRSESVCKETATHKFCPKCNKTKSHSEFHKRGMYLMGYCKPCQREYSRNKKEKQRKIIRQIVSDAKNVPCTDCNKKHPYWAMDFDHINPKNKKNNIGTMMTQNVSIETILEEINKCEVVCALCHRYRTFGNGVNRPGWPENSDKVFVREFDSPSHH